MLKELFTRYENFRDPQMMEKLVRHRDLLGAFSRLNTLKQLNISTAGTSVEGREIFHVQSGRGSKRILLWSQMHGNESTATRAFFDVFRFLGAEKDEFEPLRAKILDRLDIHFIPMVNPDGAERWQRENALGIDLNRDALRKTSPESQILSEIHAGLRPDFGFNMHDQSVYYAAGPSLKPATITLLAPPVDNSGSVTRSRKKAIRMAVCVKEILGTLIPGQIARWNEDYEPRAFGETFQSSGTATLLIEAGGFPGDPEKLFLRKLTFFLLVEALHSIASGAYKNVKEAEYEKIPLNRENGMFDRIERNQHCEIKGYSYLTDIGYRTSETFDGNHLLTGEIREGTGDLRSFGSYEECCNFLS